jgi:hypothetical protein
MYNHRPRFSLAALLAMALGGLGMPERLPRGFGEPRTKSPGRDHSPRRRSRLKPKRYHVINAAGKRVALPVFSKRPACPWVPNLAGYRWEKGQLIPRRGARQA